MLEVEMDSVAILNHLWHFGGTQIDQLGAALGFRRSERDGAWTVLERCRVGAAVKALVAARLIGDAGECGLVITGQGNAVIHKLRVAMYCLVAVG